MRRLLRREHHKQAEGLRVSHVRNYFRAGKSDARTPRGFVRPSEERGWVKYDAESLINR